MGVGIENRQNQNRSDEASSTLPRREEEPQNLSYAAAGCARTLGEVAEGLGPDMTTREEA